MNDDRLERARQGDRDALAALLKEHDAALRAAIEAELPQRWRAELSVDDILQITYTDAFLTIAQNRSPDGRSLAAWLRQAALHNLQDAVRALQATKRGGAVRRVHAATPADATRTFLDELLGRDSRTPSRVAIEAEAEEGLQRALARLPERHRQAVELYDLEGREIDEVAAALACSRGAVHLLRVRAHERLREILAGPASKIPNSA